MMIALSVNVTTHNIGQVQSIGNIPFLAGSPRYCSPSSMFMLHGLSWTFGENETSALIVLER